MYLGWLLRLYRWSQRRPSRELKWTVGIVLALAAVIWALEAWLGLPDWMQMERPPRLTPIPR
jgi:hypothetical protein